MTPNPAMIPLFLLDRGGGAGGDTPRCVLEFRGGWIIDNGANASLAQWQSNGFVILQRPFATIGSLLLALFYKGFPVFGLCYD